MRPNLQRPNNLNRYDIILFLLLNIFKFLFISFYSYSVGFLFPKIVRYFLRRVLKRNFFPLKLLVILNLIRILYKNNLSVSMPYGFNRMRIQEKNPVKKIPLPTKTLRHLTIMLYLLILFIIYFNIMYCRAILTLYLFI